MPHESSENDKTQSLQGPNGELAQAFKELARGEATAQKMESKMSELEKKIDDMLAEAEAQAALAGAQLEASQSSSTDKK